MGKMPYYPEFQNEQEYPQDMEYDPQEEEDYYDFLPQQRQMQIGQQQQQNIPREANPQPQQQATQERPYNPYYSGIRNAIAEARESFSQTDAQRNRALGASVRKWGSQIGSMPREKGLGNNLLSGLQAMSPALDEYDKYASADELANQGLADQMVKYKSAEEQAARTHQEKLMKYAAEQEHRQWLRDRGGAQDSETMRHHQAMEALKQNEMGNGFLGEEGFNPSIVPFSSKKELTDAAIARKSAGDALNKLYHLKDHYNKFRTQFEGQTDDPSTFLGQGINVGRSLLNKFQNNKKLRDRESLVNNLDSDIYEFASENERALTGGALTPEKLRIYEKQGIYPYPTDTPETFLAKVERMQKALEKKYKAADLSVRYKAHIGINDLENETIASPSTLPENVSENDNDYIIMTDPATGEEKPVYWEDVGLAEERGLVAKQ